LKCIVFLFRTQQQIVPAFSSQLVGFLFILRVLREL
jgi:hypothetical protein